ncbi:MAG: carbamoyltransferase HypF [Oscillospiraceae bacterium]|nr:carbamoyltransferase HypF [Oscillospiraceae bacterium]
MKTTVIRVYGIVQGVGFRPFVGRECLRLGIKGTVANKGSYVEIHAQCSDEQLAAFRYQLDNSPPVRSVILETVSVTADEDEYPDFRIIESEKEAGNIFVSPDIATCELCKKELYDKSNRRYLHPFINCTACGPRLTILDTMPYDRVRTSMGEFPMCPECEYEYTHHETRRFDAQPVCCNECGPEVYLIGSDIRGRAAITAVRKAISEGKIAAVKGIGGFHLCCDAKNEAAVNRLRTLKSRPMKPFAVMMKDMDAVRRECIISPAQEKIIDGHQKPIILLEKRDSCSICEAVSPDDPNVGVMLPYAPVQMLLFDYDDDITMTDCLVMTSGNARGAPICRSDEDAKSEISSFCDIMLSHDRKIRIRSDDSVMDFYEDRPYMIRRSRGYAPLPVMLSGEMKGEVLAVGGELKNTFCIGKDTLFYPSSYVGDMADIRTVDALRESVRRMETLLEASPSLVVCDMHPGYNTTAFAEELGLPVLRIQHHYAHILSCMAENNYSDKVIGVSFDGTGYGTDKTIWGGEFLICDNSGFSRCGSIAPFIQSGGDISSKEGWRIAASILRDNSDRGEEHCTRLGISDEKSYRFLSSMAKGNINSVRSTSAGRLFDAVSAVLGIRRSSTFEGEASMSLMFEAMKYDGSDYDKPGKLFYPDNDMLIADTNSLLVSLAGKYHDGGDRKALAYEFHAVLADMICEICAEISENSGINVCALSGGVFQNKLLLDMVKKRLEANGMKVLIHGLIPPNDGGIALGQAVYGMYALQNNKIISE